MSDLEDFFKIKKWRSENKAPVDYVGCERLATNPDEKIYRFEVLVALMLSSQTRDQITAETMTLLKQRNLSIPQVLQWTEEELKEMIRKVSFFRRKAHYIKETALILHRDYNDDVPDTILDLKKLPGVGEKMGYLCLLCAWNKCEGIGVDVHVHRIANRLWVNTKTPRETRIKLEALFPKHLWSEVNETLVGFGQLICKSKPKCMDCPIKCPYFINSFVEPNH